MKLISLLFIGLIVLPESIIHNPLFALGVANAHPILNQHPTLNPAQHPAQDPAQDPAQHPAQHSAQHPAQDLTLNPVVGGRNPLECDACMFLANGVNQTIIHNPKVVSFVTADIEQICKVLPSSVQQLCLSAADQSVPTLLNHLGDFIATEGCSDLGICHNKYS